MFRHILFASLSCFFLFSCQEHNYTNQTIDEIKMLGNTNPVEALLLVDSLSFSPEKVSEYQNYKIDLLRIRLKDKADIMPESDKNIKKLLPYFLKNGTIEDQQEVLYYAGSTYRDLQDYPSAINYFLNSVRMAEKHPQQCDSLMLRNTFSNLSYIYNHVQDNQNYLFYAQREYEISKKLGIVEDVNLSHLGEAYLIVDSIGHATCLFDSILEHQKNSPNLNTDIVSNLLYNYTFILDIEKATDCAALLDSNLIINSLDFKEMFAFGLYYFTTNQIDSAEVCFRRILEASENLEWMYNASRYLFQIFMNQGHQAKALYYGEKFAHLSDSLNLGKRQEMASTITNVYKYNRDKEEELQLKEERMEYRNRMFGIILACTILLSLLIWYAVSIRHKHLKESLKLNHLIRQINRDNLQLSIKVQNKTDELEETKKTMERTAKNLEENKYALKKMDEELIKIKDELKQKEQILTERMEQNQLFIKLLHQTELEESAEDVIMALRQSAKGRKVMTTEDWRNFYQAVDRLYPAFYGLLLRNLGKFSQEQMQVCYLMRVGFSKPQIQNLTGLSRVTIWRWDKKFEWINEDYHFDRNASSN